MVFLKSYKKIELFENFLKNCSSSVDILFKRYSWQWTIKPVPILLNERAGAALSKGLHGTEWINVEPLSLLAQMPGGYNKGM